MCIRDSQEAVLTAMAHVIRANEGAPSSINIAITDGETVIATRYRNSDHEEPPSLYFHLGPMPGERTWDLDNLGGFDAMENILGWTTTSRRSTYPRAVARSRRSAGRISSSPRRRCWYRRSR